MFVDFVAETTRTDKIQKFDFQHQEEWPVPDAVYAVGAYTASDGVITVDTGDFIVERAILYVLRTEEQMYCTSQTGDALTCDRGVGSIAQPILNGDVILWSMAGEEAQEAFKGVARGTDYATGYVQELGISIGWSEYQELTKMRGGPEKDRLLRQAARTMAGIKERAMILGAPSYQPTGGINGNAMYTMAGIRWGCAQGNLSSLNNHISYRGICDGAEPNFRWGTKNVRFAITSRRKLSDISNLPEVQRTIRTQRTETTLGNRVTSIEWGGFELMLMAADVMSYEPLQNMMFIFSFEDIVKKVVKPLSFRRNIETPGAHASVVEMTEILGLEFRNRKGMGIIRDM